MPGEHLASETGLVMPAEGLTRLSCRTGLSPSPETSLQRLSSALHALLKATSSAYMEAKRLICCSR